jgi:hypothetical protein
MNQPAHNPPLPRSVEQYLAQLRAALTGADPALVQDALYDAEEYLRSELAEQAGRDEAEVIAEVAGSYGAPDEVAQIYLQTEVTVNRALRLPAVARTAPGMATVASVVAEGNDVGRGAAAAPAPTAVQPGWLRRLFGVYTDPTTYGALFYLLLSLLTGVFYFTWAVVGASLSVSMLILIIGVPLLVLFLGSIRALAFIEGRAVEALLGVRMPRRPNWQDPSTPWLKRIGAMFTDPRTWATLAYFLLMLPLGVAYFTVAVVGLSLSLSTLAAPLLGMLGNGGVYVGGMDLIEHPWTWPLLMLAGALMLTATLHVARWIGRAHGHLAKHLLVRHR